MVASFIHLCILNQSPMPLGSGKPPWTLSQSNVSYHYGKDTNVLPLPLWALVCGREFPFLERHSKIVLCRGSDMAGESFFAISGNVSTYQVCKTRAKWIFSKHHSKSLEASWLQKIFNSMDRHQPQCVLVKESSPCLFPNETSPTIAGTTPMCCLLLSELWFIAWSCHYSKATPDVFCILGDLWGGMRNPSFPYQGQAAHSLCVQSG